MFEINKVEIEFFILKVFHQDSKLLLLFKFNWQVV